MASAGAPPLPASSSIVSTPLLALLAAATLLLLLGLPCALRRRPHPRGHGLSRRVRARFRSGGGGTGGLFRTRGSAPILAARRAKGNRNLDADVKAYLQRSHALSAVASDQIEDIASLNDAARAALDDELKAASASATRLTPPSSFEMGSLPERHDSGQRALPTKKDCLGSPKATESADSADCIPPQWTSFQRPDGESTSLGGVSTGDAGSRLELAAEDEDALQEVPGERGPEEIAETLVRRADGFGLELHRDEDGRAAIAGVYGESKRSALRAGDRITSVNGTPTDTHEQALAAIRRSEDDLFLIVLRDPQAKPVIALGIGLDADGGDLQDMEL